LRREDVSERHISGGSRHELEVVEDVDAGAVEALEVEVTPVLVHALADTDRGDGERHLVSVPREKLRGVQPARIASPLRDDRAGAARNRPGQDVPRVENLHALE